MLKKVRVCKKSINKFSNNPPWQELRFKNLPRRILFMKLLKELIGDLVRKEKFTSTSQIMDTINDLFSDILEEVLYC